MSTFTLFNATHWATGPGGEAAPDFQSMGFQALRGVGADGFFDGNALEEPSEEACRAAARILSQQSTLAYLDIEHFNLDIRQGTLADVDESIRKLKSICEWYHDEAPDLRLGFYSLLPQRDYWAPHQFHETRRQFQANKSNSELEASYAQHRDAYFAWKQANRYLRQQNGYKSSLADGVDVLFPSLYTFDADQMGWVNYADANLREARRYGKPVIPFLKPVFHEAEGDIPLALDADYWRLQLETCYELADGVAIFMAGGAWGWHQTSDGTWVEVDNTRWLEITLDFMAQIESRGTSSTSHPRPANWRPDHLDLRDRFAKESKAAPEPVVEPVPEPVVEPVPEPVVKPVPEPVVKPVPEPVVEPVPEPVVKPVPEPVVKPVPEPVVEPVPGSIRDMLDAIHPGKEAQEPVIALAATSPALQP